MRRSISGLFVGWISLASVPMCDAEGLRAGAIAVDVTPPKFPVLVNGGFIQATANKAVTPLHAKALVLDDGKTKIAFVVVDSCMVPRELIDQAKALAKEKTGIPTDRMLVSATHTHTAPAAMGALGCPADPGYVEFLPGKIAEAIDKANQRLAPARAGWASVDAPEYTHTRRWIRKPNKMIVDPYGKPTGRAHMHPGYQNPDAIGPSGPSDPALTVLSVRGLNDRPIAVLANFSMHYFGTGPVSADYFGRFGEALRQLIGGDKDFVGIMSQGTSGDQHWMDYSQPKTDLTIDIYADAMAAKALEACRKASHVENPKLEMAQTTLRLRRRVPDEARLAWAKPIVAAMGDRVPKNQPEVYAKEAIYLHDEPERELILQAVRVGDLGITAIPNEVYALTGLRIKARSPFPLTMNIELANGGEGYIPPPEQHRLGGYTTWPARTAALEVQAEPKIAAKVVELLQQVVGSDQTRVPAQEVPLLDFGSRQPDVFYLLNEMEGSVVQGFGQEGKDGRLEGVYALYLEGPPGSKNAVPIRAVHLAGGRLAIPAPEGSNQGVQLWFWNGLPANERAVTGVLVSFDKGDTVSIGGSAGNPGKLVLKSAEGQTAIGKTSLQVKRWYKLTYHRDGKKVSVSVDDQEEIKSELGAPALGREISIGSDGDAQSSFEGKIGALAVFRR